MPAPSPLAPFIEPLEHLDLPYCITGSVAASVYGEPRLTADIDVVLLLHHADIDALTAVSEIWMGIILIRRRSSERDAVPLALFFFLGEFSPRQPFDILQAK